MQAPRDAVAVVLGGLLCSGVRVEVSPKGQLRGVMEEEPSETLKSVGSRRSVDSDAFLQKSLILSLTRNVIKIAANANSKKPKEDCCPFGFGSELNGSMDRGAEKINPRELVGIGGVATASRWWSGVIFTPSLYKFLR